MNAKGKLVYLQNSGAGADTDVDGCGYGCGNVEVYQPTISEQIIAAKLDAEFKINR